MRVCFVVPAHGRVNLARVCLTRLAQVCEELEAAAVVIACDENQATARELGFHLITRDNTQLGARFNDGLQHAAHTAEYAIPLGSDDLISPRLVRQMLEAASADTIAVTREMAVVSPRGELATLRLYQDGAGPCLIPARLLERRGGRPADETRARAIDASIKRNLRASAQVRIQQVDSDPLDLVDLKTDGGNITQFERLLPYATARRSDTWEALAEAHPQATVDAVRELYAC